MSLRTDSPDAPDIPATALTTQQAVVPAFPIPSSSTANSLPRPPNRPPVPLSTLERLPTEILLHIAARFVPPANPTPPSDSDTKENYRSLSRLARVSPLFTEIAQGLLHRLVILGGEEEAGNWLECRLITATDYQVTTLLLDAEGDMAVSSMEGDTVDEVLGRMTSALRCLSIRRVRSDNVKLSLLGRLSGQSMCFLSRASLTASHSGLTELILDNSVVEVDNDYPVRFRLHSLSLIHADLQSVSLDAIIGPSRGSLRHLTLFPHTTQRQQQSFSHFADLGEQLQSLVAQGHDASLGDSLYVCKALRKIVIGPISPKELSHLTSALASLPNPSVRFLPIHFTRIASSTDSFSTDKIDNLLELPSMKKLEKVALRGKTDWIDRRDEWSAKWRKRGITLKIV